MYYNSKFKLFDHMHCYIGKYYKLLIKIIKCRQNTINIYLNNKNLESGH